ncbi:ABC transporter ATP-binding protein [Thermotoga profunda]|uniref:ABC transporter ATP-binding protein n=1 Tax=Thermotoga profunda TaxID=1508420 RepID=UPI000597C34F|nr:ABC transporter ATP-binding protein [Thermotoga profunda]
MSITIEARNLVKEFGNFRAVNGVNLSINQGEIYGFLGPNGAGKTTTIRMLTGTLKPTYGEIKILGLDLSKKEIEIKSRIGVVPDEPRIYPNLRGFEFLDFVIEIYKLNRKKIKERINELCEVFGVNYLDKTISDMSHGMKQKLYLVSVLMRKPEILFLDEPTVGLDAKSAKILKMLLQKYSSEGSTVFMTTHVLEIAEKMCTRIGIINKGTLIAEGTLAELRSVANKTQASLEDIFLQLTADGEDIEAIVKEL